MPRRLLLAALLALAPLSAVPAQDWNDADPGALAQAAAQRAYTERLAGALADEGGARALALAAVLRQLARAPQEAAPAGAAPSRPVPPDPQAEAWRRAAAARAGDDIVANRLLLAAADEATRREAAQRWHAAEPDNLVPLLHSGLDAEALLARARGATRAQAHMYEGVRWIMAAHRRHPPTPAEQSALAGGEPFHADEAAAVSAMALWAAVAMPGYATLAQACSADMLRALPGRREDCRHVADLLAGHADTVADEQMGLGMLRALARSPDERADAEARLRRMDWRMLQWGSAARAQPRDGAEQFARLLADPAVRTEQQLVGRVLAEAGVSPEPPPGWTPPRR